jgi:hypothetical protein
LPNTIGRAPRREGGAFVDRRGEARRRCRKPIVIGPQRRAAMRLGVSEMQRVGQLHPMGRAQPGGGDDHLDAGLGGGFSDGDGQAGTIAERWRRANAADFAAD